MARVFVGELHVFLDGVFGLAHFLIDEGGLELRLGRELGFGVIAGDFRETGEGVLIHRELGFLVFRKVGVFLGEVA